MIFTIFDHLDIVELILAAIKCELPMDLLIMALQQLLAPRVIQAQGFCGEPMQITRSILQGCICSVGFTRAYLMDDMSYLAKKFPEADPTYM